MQVVVRKGLRFRQSAAEAASYAPKVVSVGLYGNDHAGLRPRLAVAPGASVSPGQAVFSDRLDSAIRFVSPISGRVSEVREGARRTLESLVITVDGDIERDIEAADPVADFDGLAALPQQRLRQRLQQTGLWTSIRQRPGDRLAPSEGQADAMLITALDTEPYAPSPGAILAGQWDAFWLGVAAMARFARHATWVCTGPGFPLMPPELEARVRQAVFDGPHPAGLPGTHISRLAPLAFERTVWHLGYQDTAAIGRLLLTGRLPLTRLVGLDGPGVAEPRLVRLPLGANVSGLVPTRHTSLVCGSLLAGRSAVSPFEHLGRFHRQVTVLPKEGSNLAARRLLPGAGSLLRLHPGHARPLAGGMLPHDGLDRRWGHEMPPAPLLRALMTGDHERAIALGCLDLGEEDLALASLTCPGGHDYGAYLREALDAIHGQKGG